jgi:hypothetical protein
MILLGSLTELRTVAQSSANLARFAFRRIRPQIPWKCQGQDRDTVITIDPVDVGLDVPVQPTNIDEPMCSEMAQQTLELNNDLNDRIK